MTLSVILRFIIWEDIILTAERLNCDSRDYNVVEPGCIKIVTYVFIYVKFQANNSSL